MTGGEIALFTLQSGRSFGERVAQRLGFPLAAHEEREFEWGQHKARPLESVRGKDVYVVQSLHGDFEQTVNDKLCRLLFFLGSLRDASAASLTAVVPFLCYSRKDRKTKPRDPVTTRYVAGLFESVGVDRFVTLEVHNEAAFQNAFRCQTEHLETHGLFAEFFAKRLGQRELVVVSPDLGGLKRADRYREALARHVGRDLPSAFVEKRRSSGVVSGEALVGDVANRTVLLIDDMISGGTTLARAADACRKAGAREILAAAAHGAFVPEASRVLAEAPIDQIAVLDHIPPFALERSLLDSKLNVLDASGLVAEAIRRMHDGGSLVQLLET
ncbi:MAG TPA: ribose-phosphate pyrophosphokinase [Deltaproteobacteria bacterium]|jgi:ribose-phosphate pyrophosphokinase|nr:ribose-phosphate pyrophosphokinase [Deltaproteobacteria bacterium]